MDLKQVIKTHTKFVQDIKYAPSGDYFASVGSDSKIFVYDGKTGDVISEFTDAPHTGTIVSSFLLYTALYLTAFRWLVAGAMIANRLPRPL